MVVKNRKNNNDDSYDEKIEHLFVSETKAASNRRQRIENEKRPKIPDELEVENYSHILFPIEFAIASHHVKNPNTTDKMLLKEITRGYLDWIANWFGLLEGRKKQEFDSFYDDLSKILGIEKGLLKDERYTGRGKYERKNNTSTEREFK